MSRKIHCWIHILEATIAVLIVAGVMVTVYDDQSAREVLSVEDYSYSLQNEILEDIAENRTLRTEVLNVDFDFPTDPHYAVLDSYVAAKVPEDFGYLLRVCNLGDTNDYCKMPQVIFYETLDTDVFVEETVVSAEVGDGAGAEYSPKKLKLFFWEGGFPDNYCRDECEEDRMPLFCSDDSKKVLKNVCEDSDPSDSCLEAGEGTEDVDVCGTNEQCMDGECVVSLFRKLVCPKRDYVVCDECYKYSPCGNYAGGWDSGSCDYDKKDDWTCYNFDGAWESECLPATASLPSCPTSLSACTPNSGYPAKLFYEPADSRVESCICVDTIWTPADTSQVCSTELVHQTSNCERTRDIAGTKNCVCVPVWSPLPSTVCAGVSFSQTNTCNSATQQAVGTKNCVASLSLDFSNINYQWITPDHYYYHTRTFRESNGVGVTLTNGELCLQTLGCSSAPVNYRIDANNQLVLNNLRFFTSSYLDKFTLTYTGTDDNGNPVSVQETLSVSGSSWTYP